MKKVEFNINIEYNAEQKTLLLNCDNYGGGKIENVEEKEVHIYVGYYVKKLLTKVK